MACYRDIFTLQHRYLIFDFERETCVVLKGMEKEKRKGARIVRDTTLKGE
jgi:hypothetical protein